MVVSHTGGDVAISVRDHGCGIPTQELERIFERFYRVSESGTQAGTGLGLYIAQQLAAEIGGRVSVESVPGVGSTFALELPVASRLVAI